MSDSGYFVPTGRRLLENRKLPISRAYDTRVYLRSQELPPEGNLHIRPPHFSWR